MITTKVQQKMKLPASMPSQGDALDWVVFLRPHQSDAIDVLAFTDQNGI